MEENIEIIKEIVKAKSFPMIDLITHEFIYTYNLNTRMLEESWRSILLKSNIEHKLIPQVEEIKNEIEAKVKGGFPIEVDDLKTDLFDFPFPIIPKLLPVMFKGPETEIKSNLGEVTLIEFWTTWCPYCQPPMKHNQEMLENHSNWKGKVRIIGVSFDESIENVKNRVELKKWNLIEHYLIPKGFHSDTALYFNVKLVPFAVLVGKDTKIKLFGHPVLLNLEENIQKLVDDKPVLNPVSPKLIVSLNDLPVLEKVNEYIHESRSKIAQFDNLISKYNTYLISHKISEKFSPITKGSLNVMHNFNAEEKNKSKIVEIEKALTHHCLNITVEVKVNYVNYNCLDDVKRCSKCNMDISKERHYICKECHPVLGLCEKCILIEEHIHALYLIYPESQINLDKIILFNFTSKLKDNYNASVDSNFGHYRCHICNIQPIKGPRYMCAICGDVDVCTECIQALEKPPSEISKIIEKAKELHHEMKGHCYIRFLHHGMIDFT